MTQQMPYLPNEVIFEILLRLPIKSIIKFKSVSKSWLSLLSSPRFVNTHLIFSRNNHKNIPQKLLLLTPNQNLSNKKSTLFHSLSETAVCVDLDYPLKSPSCVTRVIGSCDGLICLSVENSVILWNPSTRKWKKIPKEPIFMNQDYHCTYGFGYDKINDDYKLVLAYSSKIKNIGYNEFKVYSLKTDSWKRITGAVDGYVYSNPGVLINGVVHWDSRSHCDFNGDNSKIVYFNLVSEKQGKLDLPSHDENEDVHWDLMCSSESLFGFCHCESRGAVDIWIMKEYGVKESWSKVASVPYYVIPGIFELPLFMNEDGEVLLIDGEHLVLFHTRNNIYKDLQIQIPHTPRRIHMTTYNESLVSPHFSYEDGCELW